VREHLCRSKREEHKYVNHLYDWNDQTLPIQDMEEDELLAEYESNVVLYSGHKLSIQRPLILVARSSGSASIYVQHPELPSKRPIWVLESPFLNLAIG
jgi:hypothetical protein